MFNVSARRTNERGSPESPGLERMPAEMYVPNQEQWLELRASKRYNFCCTEYWPNNISTNLLYFRINREILKLKFISFPSKNVSIYLKIVDISMIKFLIIKFCICGQVTKLDTYNFKLAMLLGNTRCSLNSF